jgi:hypothetical protein
MRIRHVVPIAAVAATCGAVTALAAHPTADPATVPVGFLQAHNTVNNVPVSVFTKAFRSRKTDIFIQHVRLDPGQGDTFHTLPGPAFVTVVRGAIIDQRPSGTGCARKQYVAGTGFVDRGTLHQIVGGPEGADYYVVYMLPRRTGPERTNRGTPAQCQQ